MMPPTRPENSDIRNAFRNLMAKAMNNMAPGGQRISTSRDAKAMIESTDYGSATNMIDLGSSPMVGVSQASE